MNRKILSVLLVIIIFVSCGSNKANTFLRLPMVGIVQNNEVPILIKTVSEGKVRIEYKKEKESNSSFTEWQTLTRANALTANLILSGLDSDTKYQYRVEFDEGNFSKWFGFKTFPEQGAQGKFSFIFGSGMREKWATPYVYTKMKEVAPTFVALLGDQMYADYDGNLNKLETYLADDSLRAKKIEEGEVMLKEKTVLDAFRGKYQRTFIKEFQDMSSSIPIMGIWDDHDMGQDNNDGTYPYKKESRQVFMETYPTYPYVTKDEGIYYRFKIGDVDAFVLDTRWYRSPMQKEEGPDKTMLGEQQLKWLFDGLKNSKARIKIIFSSVPFNDYGGDTSSDRPGHFDGWCGFLYARKQVLSFIRENNIKGVVVFSADQHWPSAHILNWKPPVKAIAQTDTSVTYSLTELNHAIFDFSAGPFNYRRATGLQLLPENQKNPDISYEVYRPEWAKPEKADRFKPFNTGTSVYGLAEVDTKSPQFKISVKFYELDKKNLKMVELYKVNLVE